MSAVSAPPSSLVSLLGLDPASYTSHPLHGPDRVYREINCYADILIELLHARAEEPLAAMGAAVRMDFEGDQWTFFKPAAADLELLYGMDVHEMQPYRSLPEQIREQISAGRTMTVEMDSFYLPDTATTSYRSEHVKSSIIPEAIDPAGERLRYFHATGLYELEGEDYRGVFGLDDPRREGVLPPYAELVTFEDGVALAGEERHVAARELLQGHLARRPDTNPFERFGRRLAVDLPGLLDGDVGDYHDYAFATVRMAGSGFEVAASQITWLIGERGDQACTALTRVVEGCKALSFRLARRRAFEPEEAITALATAWDEAMARLDDLLT